VEVNLGVPHVVFNKRIDKQEKAEASESSPFAGHTDGNLGSGGN
jgi:hypothetical protein